MDPGEIRARKFNLARRGYERSEVDDFLGSVSDHVEQLDERLAALEATMNQLGIDEPIDVSAEIERVGADLTRILGEATSTAEQMRTRAADDAARWTAEADEQSRSVRNEADEEAQALRDSAWIESTELLEDSVAEADTLRAAGEQDALFIRAEAEREALRLTGDARRDAEENVRAARQEAERLLEVARRESEVVLESARQQAEAAQERARALEQRRAELMEELEAARASIGELEEEFDTRRQELDEDETEDEETHWPVDEGGVRIVPRERAMVSEPVDALEIAAEVEALRAAPPAEPAPPPRAPEPAPQEVVPEAVPVAGADEQLEPVPWLDDFEEDIESASPVVADEETTGELEAQASPAIESTAPAEPEPEPVREPEPEPEPEAAMAEPVPEPEPEPDDAVTDLFASLRSGVEPNPTDTKAAQPGEAAPAASVAVKERVSAEIDEPQPSPAAEPEPERLEVAERALAVRERLLLPAHNRALRSVKRGLVDLQNQALEELRVDDGWEPAADLAKGAFDEAVDALTRESVVAGHAAAAELTGSRESPQPEQPDIDDAVSEFTTGLGEALRAQIAKSKASGAGPREVAAAVSKVFRAWRTDEAERRLQAQSYRAYHAGLLAGLNMLQIAEVASVVVGVPCDRCPSNARAPWPPGGSLPEGASLPPALTTCQCTLAPVE